MRQGISTPRAQLGSAMRRRHGNDVHFLPWVGHERRKLIKVDAFVAVGVEVVDKVQEVLFGTTGSALVSPVPPHTAHIPSSVCKTQNSASTNQNPTNTHRVCQFISPGKSLEDAHKLSRVQVVRLA